MLIFSKIAIVWFWCMKWKLNRTNIQQHIKLKYVWTKLLLWQKAKSLNFIPAIPHHFGIFLYFFFLADMVFDLAQDIYRMIYIHIKYSSIKCRKSTKWNAFYGHAKLQSTFAMSIDNHFNTSSIIINETSVFDF